MMRRRPRKVKPWRGLSIYDQATTIQMLVVLVLTQSRGAYVAAGVAVAVILVLRWPRLLYASPLVLIAAGTAVYRIPAREILDAIGSSPAFGGMDARLEIWSRALYSTFR